MAKNEILPFGIGVDANVLTPAEYEALAARVGGFSSGVAKSEQLNTVWRQSAFLSSMLAQFIADNSGQDVLDDGKIAELQVSLELAIKSYANSNLPSASTAQKGIVQLSSATNSTSEVLAATPKAVKAANDAALKIVNNLSEIATAGTAAVATTLANLGLGDAAKRTVGTGTNQIPDMNSFLSGAQWSRSPDGTIVQRGVAVSAASGFINVTFPIPFTSSFNVVLSPASSVTPPASRYSVVLGASNLVSFDFVCWILNSNVLVANSCQWVAIGR
ncbi:phage tail protein [Yersinia vastinensis]|uniref:phage tail protein n=1 Tax=Yersinia vastinensis TaxID=2890318 RepID=UPI00384D111F